MNELVWDAEPTLRRPIMVVAFEGFFDAAQAATTAVRWLETEHDAELLASIDPENFFDFTKQRPTVVLDEDDHRSISWPANELRSVRNLDGPHDLVLLAGVEPHIRWGTFADLVVDTADQLNVELVVTLGAVPDIIPHTRTPQVFGSTTTPGLGSRLGLSRPQYQGPTGLVGVLHDRLDDLGLPAIALRSPVPHYALGAPHPKASQALIRHLEHVTGNRLHSAKLDGEIRDWAVRHDAAVANDDQVAAYVTMLEHQWDQKTEATLSSGEELASQFEEFLRERGDDS